MLGDKAIGVAVGDHVVGEHEQGMQVSPAAVGSKVSPLSSVAVGTDVGEGVEVHLLKLLGSKASRP